MVERRWSWGFWVYCCPFTPLIHPYCATSCDITVISMVPQSLSLWPVVKCSLVFFFRYVGDWNIWGCLWVVVRDVWDVWKWLWDAWEKYVRCLGDVCDEFTSGCCEMGVRAGELFWWVVVSKREMRFLWIIVGFVFVSGYETFVSCTWAVFSLWENFVLSPSTFMTFPLTFGSQSKNLFLILSLATEWTHSNSSHCHSSSCFCSSQCHSFSCSCPQWAHSTESIEIAKK